MIRAGDDHGVGRMRLEMKIANAERGEAGRRGQGRGRSRCRRRGIRRTPCHRKDLGRLQARDRHRDARHQLELDRREGQAGPDRDAPRRGWDNRDRSTIGARSEAAGDGQRLARDQDRRRRRPRPPPPWSSWRTSAARSGRSWRSRSGPGSPPATIAEEADDLARAHRRRRRRPRRSRSTSRKPPPTGRNRSATPTSEERRTIKRVLNGLAFGDMLQAVQQCDELVEAEDAGGGFAKPVPEAAADAGPDHRRAAQAARRDPAGRRPRCWPR